MRRFAMVMSILWSVCVTADETCYFKAGDATNPVAHFLTSPVVTCGVVPKGNWNIFTRDHEAKISDRVSATGADLTPIPTARIQARVPKGTALFIYIPRTRSAMPVQNGVIPADTEVVPLAVTAGKIVAVAAPLNAKPGETALAQFDGAINVVAVIALHAGSIGVPDVTVMGKKPLVNMRGSDTSPALVFFRDVPANARLVVSGKRWKTLEVQVTAHSGVTVTDPIIATQTSKVEVSWWAPVDPSKLAAKSTDCKASKPLLPTFESRAKGPKFVALLRSCESARVCRDEVARHELPMDSMRGTFAIEDVPAGSYVLDFEYPTLPIVSQALDVPSQESTSVNATLHYVTFFGKVTRAGKPLYATIFDAVTDPNTGEYNAVVSRLPGKGTAEVVLCDGSATYDFVPDDAPKENAPFDVDVPDDRVLLEVYDKDSGAPVSNAHVTFGALQPGEKSRGHFFRSGGTTDAEGKATIAPVLQNRMVKICAERDDYAADCAPDFKMEDPEKHLRIDLQKIHVHYGRIEGGAGTRAQLVWFSLQSGTMTEMIRAFKEDGSFTYKKDHPGQVVVAVAADRPLYAFLQPPLDPDATLTITRPLAPVRTFTVSLAESWKEPAEVALQIGDLMVPQLALDFHIGTRFHVVAPLGPGGSLTIPDILQTGPIKVILLPLSAYGRDVQLPLAPDIAGFPHQDLGARDSVTFQ